MTKARTWTRLAPARIRNTGGSLALASRVYGLAGKVWPRLRVAVYAAIPPAPSDSVSISIAQKKRPGDWWEEATLPLELPRDLTALLEESKRATRARRSPSRAPSAK